AMSAGLDDQRAQRISEIFSLWAKPRVPVPLTIQTERVAHVVGSLLPADTRSRHLATLVSSLKKHGVASTIFTTESSAAWFFNTGGVPLSHRGPIEADVQIGSVHGNFAERASRIADAIGVSGIQVAFFHGGLEEQITTYVAAMRPAPVQLCVDYAAGA